MVDLDAPVDVTFRAMGSSCRILLDGGPVELPSTLQERLGQLERAWSRFLPDSEVSALNRSAGVPVIVGADTLRLIVHAEAAWRFTEGWFDPMMLDALEALGYDRDHRSLATVDPSAPWTTPRPADAPERRSPMVDLEIDEPLHLVVLPVGCRFDPGGLGKGLAADMLVDLAMESGADGVLVDLGGDLRVGGRWFGNPVWPALVAHPVEPQRDLAELRIAGGALATSSRLRRRWTHGEGVVHHLLDPHTEQPSTTELMAVTVHAGTAWYGEAVAKACLLAGPTEGGELIKNSKTAAILYGEDGDVTVVGNLEIERLEP